MQWYADMGVDIALDEAPHDRLAEAGRPLGPRPSCAGRRPAARAPACRRRDADRDAGRAAQARAVDGAFGREPGRASQTLLARFEGCALKTTAKSLVFADGNPAGPGDARGRGARRGRGSQRACPSSGASGQLLDRMLAAIGLDRTKVYIANVIPWRPPGNRTPTPQEAAVCQPFIERQIELADPDILVCLGGPSAQSLLGLKDGIMQSRGRWIEYDTGTRTIRAIATLHPAYLLRQPLQKRLAWRDFKAIRDALEEGERGLDCRARSSPSRDSKASRPRRVPGMLTTFAPRPLIANPQKRRPGIYPLSARRPELPGSFAERLTGARIVPPNANGRPRGGRGGPFGLIQKSSSARVQFSFPRISPRPCRPAGRRRRGNLLAQDLLGGADGGIGSRGADVGGGLGFGLRDLLLGHPGAAGDEVGELGLGLLREALGLDAGSADDLVRLGLGLLARRW